MEMDAASVRELQSMLAAKKDVASLTPIEARLSEVLSTMSPSTGKRLKRHCLLGDDEYDMTDQTFLSIGLSLHDVPVTFDDIDYPSIMNAFQAQKAPEEGRKKYTTVSSIAAVDMGRHESIDIKEWDDGKDDLMVEILRVFISQHPDLQRVLLSTDVTNFVETSVADVYWPKRIPSMWKAIKEEIQSSS